MSDAWYNPNYGFRRRLVIVPPEVQPIEMGFPLTVMVENQEWQTLKKIRLDDLDVQVVYIDPELYQDQFVDYVGGNTGFYPNPSDHVVIPNDPLGYVGVANYPNLHSIPVGTRITVTGMQAGFAAGIWTGTVTESDATWIKWTPDTTVYQGDDSAAWDEYALGLGGDCQVIIAPAGVAIPHKQIYPEDEEHLDMMHVVFNAEMDLMDTEMATPAINMDYYLYYGNPSLAGHETFEFSDSDYIIKLTPDDYNFSLTFSRPTEHWINGLSDKINARFALNFFGLYARLTMEKGPDRGIMELRVDDQDPIYIDTFGPVYSEEIVYTTDMLPPGDHAIRCRITGDKNAASESHALQFVSFEYSVFVEAIEGPEEINPANAGIVFITGV